LPGGEIRQSVEREDGLKSKCPAFELQVMGIGESLAQTEARLAEEKASGAAAEESGSRLSACEASSLAAEALVRDKVRSFQTV
jgi:hypothetical protein